MGGEGQAHPLDSQATDTLNTRIVPIILVPGVMGTRLDISGAASDWDPDDSLEMAGWVTASRRRNTSQLDFRTGATVMTNLERVRHVPGVAEGVNPVADILARDRLKEIAVDQQKKKVAPGDVNDVVQAFYEGRGWGGVVWSFYGQILMQLTQELNPGSHGGEQHPVYACGYDWRQSNATSAARVSACIDRALAEHQPAKQVVLLTHSMGGLASRASLLRGTEPKILGIVHTVIPADGAVVAYRRFLTGARAEFNDGPGPFLTILGGTRLHYSVMQSVLRGPTELVPGDSYPEEFLQVAPGITNKSFTDVFAEFSRDHQQAPGIVFTEGEVDKSEKINLTISKADVQNLLARLSEARTFTRSVALRFHANTFLMIGDKHQTDTGFDFTKSKPTASGGNMGPMVQKTDKGDGTVPAASARADGCTPIARDPFPVPHGECFQFPFFRTAVLERIRRVLAL
jgi:hypothetical protein